MNSPGLSHLLQTNRTHSHSIGQEGILQVPAPFLSLTESLPCPHFPRKWSNNGVGVRKWDRYNPSLMVGVVWPTLWNDLPPQVNHDSLTHCLPGNEASQSIFPCLTKRKWDTSLYFLPVSKAFPWQPPVSLGGWVGGSLVAFDVSMILLSCSTP